MANKIVFGAGEVRFSEDDADGNLTNLYRYLDDSPGLEWGVQTGNAKAESSDGPSPEILESVTNQLERTFNLTLQSMSYENLALYAPGEVSTHQQSSGSVTDEPYTAMQGFDIQLGLDAANPGGSRGVSNIVVTGTGGTPSYPSPADWTADLDQALLTPVVGGGLPDSTPILVDWDESALSWARITSDNLGPKYGALIYRENNARGENKKFWLPRVQMTPTGTVTLKSRQDNQKIQFQVEVLKRDGFEAIYINGAPA